MSYLQRRGAVWWFRKRLPTELAGSEVPVWWPDEHARLVNSKRRFKTELSYSLDTKDERTAKRRGSQANAHWEAVFAEARTLRDRGTPITDSDVDAFRNLLMVERLEGDDTQRRTAGTDAEPLTDLELDANQHIAMIERDEARKAIARLSLPQHAGTLGERRIDSRLHGFLHKRGVHSPLLTPAERQRFHMAAAQGRKQAVEIISKRNEGEWIDTPAIIAQSTVGPRIKQALQDWSKGVPSKNIAPPQRNTRIEAQLVVRWFVDLHGDIYVADIRRDHVRKYRDAIAKLPGRGIRKKQRALKLPELVSSLPSGIEGRSLGSITKHLTLLGSIIKFTANENDFEERLPNWTNPVAGQKPRAARLDDDEAEGRDRDPFSLTDLQAIFSAPSLVGPKRAKSARGAAAKFFPLIAMLSGLRLDEIGQLHVRNLRQHPEHGGWMFDVVKDQPDKRLKTPSSKRFVPVHEELVRCGLLEHHAKRLADKGPDVPLFDGFAPNANGKWTHAWSKWFGRFLRLEVGIVDKRKVFHSFRHSFNDACTNSGMGEATQWQLMGHKKKGTNARYGEGAFFEGLNKQLQRIMTDGIYRDLDLSHLHVQEARRP